MNKPLVSIITPSYNQVSFIVRTIESVINQSYPNIEHVIIDGGSTDGTLKLLENYESKYNLRWISEPDQGQSQAINKGFRMSRGAIIGWVNSDDTLSSKAAEKAVNYLLAHEEIDWVYGDCLIIDENDQILTKQKSQEFDLKKLITERQFVFQPTVFFRDKIFDEIGYLDESFHFTMDFDFFIRMGIHFQSKYIPQVMASRRIHSHAKTLTADVEFENEAITSINKIFNKECIPKEIRVSKNKALCNRYFRRGVSYFRNGDNKKARKDLIHAIKIYPQFMISRRGIIGILLILQSLMGWNVYKPKGRYDQYNNHL